MGLMIPSNFADLFFQGSRDFRGTQTVVSAVFFSAVSVLSASARVIDRLAVFAHGAFPVAVLATVIYDIYSYFADVD